MLTRPQLGLTPAESSARQPELPQPPAGAPNVIVILFDDLGFAQLGCFGSAIETPNIDRLAAGGLRYNRFHVPAICSPTRSEEQPSELQSLMRISYAVFCLPKK